VTHNDFIAARRVNVDFVIGRSRNAVTRFPEGKTVGLRTDRSIKRSSRCCSVGILDGKVNPVRMCAGGSDVLRLADIQPKRRR